jgi:hypothetical protein
VVNADIVLEAIAAIERINGDAINRIGLLVNDYSAERVEADETDLFLSFRVGDDATAVAPDTSGAFIGERMPTGTMPAVTVPDPETRFPSRGVNAQVKKKKSSSQGKTTPAQQRPRNIAGWGRDRK